MNFFRQHWLTLKAKAGQNQALQAAIQKFLPELEKFVIAGPTLIGFLRGLLSYAPGHVAFETGFQSLVFFLAYLVSLIVLQALDSLFFGSWPIVLGVARSVLAVVYLALTLRQYAEWRSGNPRMLGQIQNLRQYLNRALDTAP